jgi:HAMP domain-containing protein
MDYVVVVLSPLPEDLTGITSFVAQRFKIPEDRAAQLLRRVPGPVTKPVAEAQARTVAAILAEAGLEVELREGGVDGPAVPFAAPAPPADAGDREAGAPSETAPPGQPFDPRAEGLGIGPSPARVRAAEEEGRAAEAEVRAAEAEAGAAEDGVGAAEEAVAPGERAAGSSHESAAEGGSAERAPEADDGPEEAARSTQAPPAGTTTTTPPRDPTKTTLVREPPDVDRRGLRRRIATAATLPAVLTLLAALVVLSATLLPALRAQQLERAQGTATAVAATIEGLSGGLPASSPVIRARLVGVQDRAAAELADQGVAFVAVVGADGRTVLGWEGRGDQLSPATSGLVEEAARGALPLPEAGWVDSLSRTWGTLLTVVGLRGAEPVVAAARMERLGSPLGTVVVGVDPSGLRDDLGRVLLTALLVGLVPVLFAVLAALSLTRGITDAVRYLLVATDRISHGDLEQPVELRRDDELGQIARAVERMRISLREGLERLRRRR